MNNQKYVQTLMSETKENLNARKAEYKRIIQKWEKTGLLDGLDQKKGENVAVLLENQCRELLKNRRLLETSLTSGGESWSNVALPLVRKAFADLIAPEVVSIQPMTLPSGLIFYVDYQYDGDARGNPRLQADGASVYGYTSGSNAAKGGLYGDQFGGPLNAFTVNFYSASSVQTASVTTSSDPNNPSGWNNALLYEPTLTGSIAKRQIFRMKISGATIGSDVDTTEPWNVIPWSPKHGLYCPTGSDTTAVHMAGTGEMGGAILRRFTTYDANDDVFTFYLSGVQANMLTGSAESVSGSLSTVYYKRKNTATTRGDFEPDQTGVRDIPKVKIQLTQKSIVAQTRRLRADWSEEIQQDLDAYHNIDAEKELSDVLSQFVSLEIDREILNEIRAGVQSTNVKYWSRKVGREMNDNGAIAWDNSSSTYLTHQEWYQTLLEKIEDVANRVYQNALLGTPNWLIISPQVKTILKSCGKFVAEEKDVTHMNVGIQYAGTFDNTYKVYVDPYAPKNEILIGLLGGNWLQTGYVYAPYVPIIMTPTLLNPVDFQPTKGLMTRGATKMVRPEFYGKVVISDINVI